MFFSKKKVLGLDIGLSSIKMAEVDFAKSSIQIHHYIQRKTPPGIFQGIEIQNPSLLAQTIKSMATSIHTKRRSFCIGLWGPSIIVKKISIPKVDNKMLAEQMKWEAEQYIPFDQNEVVTSYHVLGPGTNMDTLDILLIAAQKSFIKPYYQAIEEAGFEVGVVDISSFALANIYEINYGKSDEVIALFNIGFQNTNMIVLTNGKVIFSRDLPIGGSLYTQEISKELHISFDEAESLKLSFFSKGEVPTEIPSIVQHQTTLLCEEIRNGLDFFSASTSNTNIHRCYVTGGGSQVPGLLDQLSKSSSLPFVEFNPLKNVNFGKSLSIEKMFSSTHFCATALGLGLREVKDS